MQDQPTQRSFPVEGMTCASCVIGVERALSSVPGVGHVRVNLADHSATVVLDRPVADELLRNAVRSAGYDLVITDVMDLMEALERAHTVRLQKIRRRFIIAATLSLPLVVVAMLLPHGTFNQWLQFLLVTPVILGTGSPFFRNAWRQARHGQANMDSLVALSTAAAFLYSTYRLFFDHDVHAHMHYESAAVVITFVWLGRYLEARAKSSTGGAIRKLMGMRPDRVLRVAHNGQPEEAPIAQVLPGDVLLVRTGERVAVDGTVIEGRAAVDGSMFSGEPLPVERLPGAHVLAGMVVLQGTLRIRATQVGAGTYLSRVAQAVQEAQGSRAPVQLLVDRVALRFVPVVLVIATAAALAWSAFGGAHGAERGMQAFITVLIIACPCALGLATPTAIMAGIGKGAEQGILIRGADSLERAHRITAVVLDKTGTLTEGRPTVVDRWTDLTHNELATLAAIEQRSTHPLARALMSALPDPAGAAPIDAVTEVPGEGMQATINGAVWLVGNRRALESGGVRIDREHGLQERAWQELGRTTVWLAANGRVRGLFALEDMLRPSAPSAIAALKATGVAVYMQTGDGARVARRVAAAVGIEHVRAEVSPRDKAAFVQGLRDRGAVVAMVGDGVNDAAALAAADVSFAMGQGSDVAMGVAHITVLAGDLAALPEAVKLSRRTMRTIRQNLFWAFVYNVISIPVAAGLLQPSLGFTLDPMWAGLAMAFSSVSVVLNSLRLRLG